MKFKVRRLLYDEVVGMEGFPNFGGAAILRFCLTVMGLSLGDQRYCTDTLTLQKAALSWVRRKYTWLSRQHPSVAKACLPDGTDSDANGLRLQTTRPVDAFGAYPKHEYFEVDSARSSIGQTPERRKTGQPGRSRACS